MGLRLSPDLERKVLELAGQPAAPASYFDPDVSEREFQAEVMRAAKEAGWHCYHVHDSRKSAAGFPDLVLVKDRTVVAELKIGDNQPTAAQLNWLDWFRAAGVPAYLWRPEDWLKIVEVLTGGSGDRAADAS